MKLRKNFTMLTFVFCFIINIVVGYNDIYARTMKSSYTLVTEKENYEYTKMEQKDGVLLGAYVIQDDFINQDMNVFNDMTGKKHASFFRYVGYGRPFPKEWVEEVKAVGGIPHIAFEPNKGLEAVQDDEYLNQWAQDAYDAGVPIFIRWASEMNGTWTHYSGKSDLYKEKWKMVYNIFNEKAPNCSFVWTVFTFPESTIEEFYPGDKYVDWVGVNIYSVIYHNDNKNDLAKHEDPLELLDFVYNTYSYKKPIQISEFGATHYTSTDDKEYHQFAINKISRLYRNLETYYPRVKSIFYFDVNNTTQYNHDRRINDYSITNVSEILKAYKKIVADKYFLSDYEENFESVGTERLTYNGFTTIVNGSLNAPIEYFENYLGIDIDYKNGKYYASKDGNKIEVKATKVRQQTNFHITRNFTVIPVTSTVKKFGYNVIVDSDKNLAYINKK